MSAPGPDTLEEAVRSERLWGLFDELGLTVRYDFTSAEVAGFEAGDAVDHGVLATVIHETVHLYQSLATHYGAYIHRLKSLQAIQALRVIEELKAAGLPVGLPLGRYIRSLPRDESRADRASQELFVWYVAEALIACFERAPGAPGRVLVAVMDLTGDTFAGLFNRVEEILVFQDPGSQILGADLASGRSIASADPRREAGVMFMAFQGLDAVGIMEAAARAAEGWWSEGAVSETEDLVPAGPAGYEALVATSQALKRWRSMPGARFAIAFGALADLALCPPVLPEHASLRSEDTTFLDLHPAARFIDALLLDPAVEPARDLADAVRYQAEVCRRRDWPTPWALAQFSDRQPRPEALPARVELFRSAQAWRARIPTAFIDLDVWRGLERLKCEFRADFSHWVMEYRDKTLFHKDKERLFGLLHEYAIQTLLRATVLERHPVVTMPFAAGPDELALFEQPLRDLLLSVGVADPDIALRSRPAHVAGMPDPERVVAARA